MTLSKLDADLADLGIDPSTAILPTIKAVPAPSHVHWDRCKQWIAEGLGDSMFRIEDLEDMISDGRAILWPGAKCAIVTEFVDYSSGQRAAQVMSAGGDLDEIKNMVPGMEAFARLNGCSVIWIEGRMGWQKVMKDQGYTFSAVTLRKAL